MRIASGLDDNFVTIHYTHESIPRLVYVQTKQRAQQHLSTREHFYIDWFKGYKMILYIW